MSSPASYRQARLKPHPSCRSGPAQHVEVDYWRDGRFLLVRFSTMEDNDWIDWPELIASGRRDELWRATCFEVFVQTADGYLEYNLSPSSEWATYRFDRYREGMRPADEGVVSKGTRFRGLGTELEAQLELPDGVTKLAFSAVLRTVEGETFYWALAHPSDKPDFHHPDSFVLELT